MSQHILFVEDEAPFRTFASTYLEEHGYRITHAGSASVALEAFAKERLGRSEKGGEIDWDNFNVHGGSISIGHPFAATGARLIGQALKELGRRDGQFALVTACAAGGLGASVVLERV